MAASGCAALEIHHDAMNATRKDVLLASLLFLCLLYAWVRAGGGVIQACSLTPSTNLPA